MVGLLKRAGDLVYTFRFISLLVTPFEKTDAFKRGIIDAKGNRNKSYKIVDSADKSAYTPFHKLVFNINKLMAKVPGGSSSIASYGAALYLIKEDGNLRDPQLEQILEKTGFQSYDFLAEKNEWYVLNDGRVSPGLYKVKYDKIVNSTYEPLVIRGDKVRVSDNAYPVGDIFGLNIYEGTHINTNQKIYFALEELIE